MPNDQTRTRFGARHLGPGRVRSVEVLVDGKTAGWLRFRREPDDHRGRWQFEAEDPAYAWLAWDDLGTNIADIKASLRYLIRTRAAR